MIKNVFNTKTHKIQLNIYIYITNILNYISKCSLQSLKYIESYKYFLQKVLTKNESQLSIIIF